MPHGFGLTVAFARGKLPALYRGDGGFIQALKAAGLLDFNLFRLPLGVDINAQQYLALLAHALADRWIGRRWVVEIGGVA